MKCPLVASRDLCRWAFWFRLSYAGGKPIVVREGRNNCYFIVLVLKHASSFYSSSSSSYKMDLQLLVHIPWPLSLPREEILCPDLHMQNPNHDDLPE